MAAKMLLFLKSTFTLLFLLLALRAAPFADENPAPRLEAGAAGFEAIEERMALPKLGAELLKALQADEEKLDLFCLRQAYPAIKGIEARSDGSKWLLAQDGQSVLYSRKGQPNGGAVESDSTTVAESMELAYALEPARPDLSRGASPGRKRSQALLSLLYGGTRESVGKGLASAAFRGARLRLHGEPMKAFKRAIPELEKLAASRPSMKPYLVPGGGFNWRKIAGENRLSPHAYGIALDLGVKVAPYWRWAKINPHPAQKTYPPEIVRAMEAQGFIWGGKWHEYDLMHFEYRPELICKAKIKALF